eukprot:gnl/MRDRNA2_/MRDRNA2_27212_c0_seq1.p1 gnl/MRDRNA2_/MRDRNA2_27212_c0~~gnl/MRDRNA2_/MRDRNA2_27212_c0_seq1.p1  ORF type:complete len:578 (-),score=73.27 gnl/MRDRNA2_/MRDRNA2_27212_c0_seq1:181-1914(-)
MVRSSLMWLMLILHQKLLCYTLKVRCARFEFSDGGPLCLASNFSLCTTPDCAVMVAPAAITQINHSSAANFACQTIQMSSNILDYDNSVVGNVTLNFHQRQETFNNKPTYEAVYSRSETGYIFAYFCEEGAISRPGGEWIISSTAYDCQQFEYQYLRRPLDVTRFEPTNKDFEDPNQFKCLQHDPSRWMSKILPTERAWVEVGLHSITDVASMSISHSGSCSQLKAFTSQNACSIDVTWEQSFQWTLNSSAEQDKILRFHEVIKISDRALADGSLVSSHVPGSQFQVPVMVGSVIASIPLICTVAMLIWLTGSKYFKSFKHDVVVSSLDFTSDIFWSLSELFYNEAFQAVAFFLVWGHSMLFVLVRFANIYPPVAERTLYFMLGWQVRRLKEKGIYQHYTWEEIEGSLEMMLLNILSAFGLLVLVILGVPPALILWMVEIVGLLLLGVFLHATRFLAIFKVQNWYLRAWGFDMEIDEANSECGVHPATWNWIVFYEFLGESLPCLACNISNMIALQSAGAKSITIPGILALCSSGYMAIRLGFRFNYWRKQGKSVAEVPIQLATEKAAASAAAAGVL